MRIRARSLVVLSVAGMMIGIGVLAYASTASVTAAPEKRTNAQAQKLKRSRKLKQALKACNKDKSRNKRARCIAAARLKYGAKTHKTKKKHKAKVPGSGTTGTGGTTTGGTTGTATGAGGTTGTGGGTTGTTGPTQEVLTVAVAQTSEGTVSGTGGISCPGTCSASYAYGTQVTLTANPDSGYAFSGWSGACSGTGSCVVTMDAAETVTASFSVAPFAAATPGSYSGSDTTSVGGDTGSVSFYVSPDASTIQDLRATTYQLCTPSTAVFVDKIQAASIPIESNGAFSYSGSSTGVFENSAATFKYTFSGMYGVSGFAGQLTETISYGSGTTYSCTSNLQSWSATRESSQGTQTNAPAQAGSYSGSGETTDLGGDTGSVSFYVSPDASTIQDLRATTYQLCAPSAAVFVDKIQAASIPIESNGAFSYSGSSTGVFANTAATFKYTIAGHLHGLAASGEQRVAGQLTETISYGSGTTYSCTSNLQSWSATRESSQGTQTNAPAQAGSYSGSGETTDLGGDTGSVSFYVSPDASTIQDLRATTYQLCAPSAAVFVDKIQAASIPIESNGAFSYSGSSTGVFANTAATFKYTIAGHLHGLAASGEQRVAGQLTETISYGSGTTYSCTSNLQSWSATRESSQGTQTNAPAQAGSYSGSGETTDLGGDTGSVSFYVSPDASTIQDLRATTYQLCAPSAAVFVDKIQAASIPIESNGAFSYSGSSTGVFANTAATFKYTIAGHLHGLAASGEQRVAGQLTETISYGSGTTYSCTSNLQSWSATRESSQGTQTNAPAQAGSYSGSGETTDLGGDTGSVKFSVSGGGTAIDNLEVSAYELCDPTAPTFVNTFAVSSIPIESNGSFSYNASTSGTYDSSAATFMLTFQGHFHGLDSSGNQRVAGQYTATVTYGSGTTYSCTSDLQSWKATD